MFQELIDAIQQGVKGLPVTIGGKEYSTRPVFDPPEPRLATALKTHTLQSLVDYLDNGIDAASEGVPFILIESPYQVLLALHLDGTNRRECRVAVIYKPADFKFGEKYDQATFITLLRSQFVPSEGRERVQRFVGSLTDESSLKLEDDGVVQRTVAKTGIATYSNIETGTPIVLAPFRTFPEIEQPESEFIVRLHRREGAVPAISLHEADNNAWKLESINRIAEWFKKQGVKVPILA